MSGDLRRSTSMADTSPTEGSRNLGNGRHSPTSPLKLFGQAKKQINHIYVEIGNYIEESNKFLGGDCTALREPLTPRSKLTIAKRMAEDGIVVPEQREQVQSYVQKVAGIREMLSRDRMKVAFFGRTSNGKSTVINAMLKERILPSGIGHTTNCFVQVEGCDNETAYLLTDADSSPQNIQTVRQLAHALSNVKLDQNCLIRICWPKNQCSLLRDDVVLVDSPGIDVSPDLDSWIDEHCLDADVFVLVANAESTLMQTEKNFFHKVSTKLSKPNIFILNNRWDASASEPEFMEEVKQQHWDRNVAFLVDELKVMTRQEAENRVFFVSAREALISRSNQERGTPTPTEAEVLSQEQLALLALTPNPGGALLEGFQGRLFEFCNFERKFEECISQSAVQTKFAQHTENGKLITSHLRLLMEDVFESALTKKNKCELSQQELRDKLDYTEKQMNLLTSEIKDKIRHMVEEVDRKVSSALTEEIRRLALLVDEFDRPFHPDAMLLNVYKKELYLHIESAIGRNLQERLSHELAVGVRQSCGDMTERLTALLPAEAKQQALNFIPNKDFEVTYRLDCRSLCGDFKEDIEFRFSLGIASLMNRFLGPKGTKRVLMGYTDIPPSIPTTPQTPSNENYKGPPTQETELIVTAITTFTSLYSRSTIGALAISGLVAKAAGWRVIAICGAIYGLLYVYERLTWTNKAKERAFKKQYVDYATGKLKLILDLTSSNSSHQVQQELQSTFGRLSRQVDIAKEELDEELKKLDSEISKLDTVSNRASFLKNKAGYLDSELNGFIQQFLKVDSHL